MLVNNSYLLKRAFEEKHFVDAFNANNLEQIHGIVEATAFIKLNGVDALAVAVSIVHRMRVQEMVLNIDRIRAIRKLTNIPLVLHGSSDVTNNSLKRAIKEGLCKINVATALNMIFTQGMSAGLKANPNEINPRKILSVSREEVKKVVKQKIRIFESKGEA